MTTHSRALRRTEQGFYIVFFAILMGAFLLLIGLVIGLGVIAGSSTRMQHLANVASLAALKSVVDDRAVNPSTPISTLASNARDRADAVLGENRILFATAPAGGLQIDGSFPNSSGGRLRLGAWFTEDPDGSDPCNDSSNNPEPSELDSSNNPKPYPCFIPIDSSSGTPAFSPNTVRVDLQNASSNPILAPFTRLFGITESQVSALGTAALLQRCTAYVLDITLTSTQETHPLPSLPPNPWRENPGDTPTASRRWDTDPATLASDGWSECYDDDTTYYLPGAVVCPQGSGMFAYHIQSLTTENQPIQHASDRPGFDSTCYFRNRCDGRLSTGIATGTDCAPTALYSYISSIPYNFDSPLASSANQFLWCNLLFSKNQVISESNPMGRTRFREHYSRMLSPSGSVLIDLFTDPEPLSSFFLAFNSGLRLVRQQSTSGDRAVVIPFDGEVRFPYPPPANPGDPLTTTPNLDILIQLTNIRNRGTPNSPPDGDPSPLSRMSPNFVDMGWFPLNNGQELRQRTHIVSALDAAVSALSASCPATAQKSIVLATDGIPNCARGFTGQDCYPATLGRHYLRYEVARDQLIDQNDPTSIISKLRENRISLTTILRGDISEPNFRNIILNGRLLDPNEALRSGLYAPNAVVDATSICPGCPGGGTEEEKAFVNAGQPGVFFRAPNEIFATLAQASGGVFCPVMNLCTSIGTCCGSVGATYADCYDNHDSDPLTPRILRPQCRPDGSIQRCSPAEQPPGAIAARCVAETVGGNPYILVN